MGPDGETAKGLESERKVKRGFLQRYRKIEIDGYRVGGGFGNEKRMWAEVRELI